MAPETEEDYLREPIPDFSVLDLAGGIRSLTSLATGGAALLLYAPTEGASGGAPWRVPALCVGVPHLGFHYVLSQRADICALPPEARHSAVIDPEQRTHARWGIDGSQPAAVLLGIDGMLAGGPVFGGQEVEEFVRDVREAILAAAPFGHVGEPEHASVSTSIDVLIPFRCASGERLRNLVFTIGYYRRHLPSARIILAEQNERTLLPGGTAVDRHLVAHGDPDLFNKSLLLNAAAAESTASYLVFADADCIPEVGMLASLEGIARMHPMTYVVPHSRVNYLTAGSSSDFVANQRDNQGDVTGLETTMDTVTVGGVTFCSAELFHQLGGYAQQRYLGWGGEDDDLYNRCLVSTHPTTRVQGELLHLDHPPTVRHSFNDEEMAAKRALIPPSAVPSPHSRLAAARAFFLRHRVALATNSLSPALLAASRQFSEQVFPEVHVVEGSTGTYGLSAFLELLNDARLDGFDYLIYSDEDNLLVDWSELRSTVSAFIGGGYGFAGMPDGGVISHRFHNPVAINPFLAFFDLRQVRAALAGHPAVTDRFGLDLVTHWPSPLVRTWDGRISHPRIRVVLEEGYVPYGTARDDFEPYYALWFRLLRAGLRPMYLAARDAPQLDDDGCCTAILGVDGQVMAYHSWFARSYGRDLEQTIRINKVLERARSHVRW